MRIIHFDEKEGKMKVSPENVEDLWHLEKIINAGDIVIGKTVRRFRPAGAKAGETGEKKEVTIELEVEKVELHKHANILRVMGKIIGGTPEEYVQKGSHHTIELEPRYNYVIRKMKWNDYEKERLKEAQRSARRPIVRIVVLDDWQATVATLRGHGIDFEFEIKSRTSKKDENYEEKIKKYFSEIEKILDQSEKSIVAGPGFTADSFRDYLKERNPKLLKTIYFSHASTSERSGVYELVKGGVIASILKEDKLSLEFEKMENFLTELRKEGLATYGPSEVKQALDAGAVKELFVLDEFVRKDPEVLEIARKRKIIVTVFTSEEEPWKKLKAFGGIAGILKYKLS